MADPLPLIVVSSIDFDSFIRSRATLRMEFRSGGTLVDPNVSVQVKSPSGVNSFEYYGLFGSIKRVSAGIYTYEWTLSEFGEWRYKVNASGSHIGTDGDHSIRVDATNFPAVDVPVYAIEITSPEPGDIDVPVLVTALATPTVAGSTPLTVRYLPRGGTGGTLAGPTGTIASGVTANLPAGEWDLTAEISDGYTTIVSPRCEVTVE